MLRASAVCEAAGIPTSSLICEGFVQQAKAVSGGLAMNLPVAVARGHIAVQGREVLKQNILEATLEQVIANLTRVAAPESAGKGEPGARDIVFTGGFDAVNAHFYEREWSDGLPIVPPTLEKIESFLRRTDRQPDESLGTLLPEQRQATIWSVAVNAVMAGCRPEYMPLLVAMVEALADPRFGVEHSGATPGGETLVIVSGPMVKDLGFNFTQGVMRDGIMPNTSIGRFWRLYLRNVAGFRLHQNDKATYGNTWRVVVAENGDCIRANGWSSFSADRGFEDGQNSVTIANYTGGNVVATVSGDPRTQMLPYLADAMVRQISWQLCFTVGAGLGKLHPLLLLTPILVETFAQAGISKQDVKQYLFEHARISASQFQRILSDWSQLIPGCDLAAKAQAGEIPKVFGDSADPERPVPLVWTPEDYQIVVTGDPLRNNAYVFAPSGLRGYAVTKAVALPAKRGPD